MVIQKNSKMLLPLTKFYLIKIRENSTIKVEKRQCKEEVEWEEEIHSQLSLEVEWVVVDKKVLKKENQFNTLSKSPLKRSIREKPLKLQLIGIEYVRHVMVKVEKMVPTQLVPNVKEEVWSQE